MGVLFSHVLVIDPDEMAEIDPRLLFVAITRARTDLRLFQIGRSPALTGELEKLPEDVLTRVTFPSRDEP